MQTQPLSRSPVDRIHETIANAIRTDNLRMAKRILKACVQRNRHDGQAWELFGIAHYQSGNFPSAICRQRLVELRLSGCGFHCER